MSKYYVQCGPVRMVLSADGVEMAAVSAIERALQCHLWIYDDPDLSDEERRMHLMLESLLHLEPTIRISERGFDREDADQWGTPEAVEYWHRLMTGMNRLFVAAGLAPRSLSNLGQIQSNGSAGTQSCVRRAR